MQGCSGGRHGVGGGRDTGAGGHTLSCGSLVSVVESDGDGQQAVLFLEGGS